MNAWYAIEVVALIPLGIYFFSFAVSTGIRGLMSLGFGEYCQYAQRSALEVISIVSCFGVVLYHV